MSHQSKKFEISFNLGTGDRIEYVTAEQMASLCGVSIRTAKRWIVSGLPPMASALAVRVFLGVLVDDWLGWHISADGLLIAPSGRGLRPGEIEALTWLKSQL